MCDTGDLVDIGAGVLTFGGSYIYKKATGSDLPGVKVAKAAAHAVLGSGPDQPKPLPEIPVPPPPPDPTSMIIQRAMSAERLRQQVGGMGASFLTGPGGLKSTAPVTVPKAAGY